MKRFLKRIIALMMTLVIIVGILATNVRGESHSQSSKNDYERYKLYWRMRRMHQFYAKEYINTNYDEDNPSAKVPYYNFRDFDNYQDKGGIIYGIKLKKNQQFHGSIGPVDEDNPYNITIQSMGLLLEEWTGLPNGIGLNRPMGDVILDDVQRDYEFPVAHTYRWVNQLNMGYDMPYWFIVKLVDYKTPLEKENHEEVTKELWGTWIDKYSQLINKAEEIEAQGKPKGAGDYYLRDAEFLRRAAYEWNILLTENIYYFMDPRIENDRGRMNPKRFTYDLTKEQIVAVIDTIDEVLRYVENNKVKDLEILSYEVEGHLGEINREDKTIRLKLPAGKSVDLSKALVETPRGILCEYDGKSLTENEGNYSLYAVEPLYHNTFYENELVKDKPYEDTKTTWTVKLEETGGENKPSLNSLDFVSFDGEVVKGEIDHDKGQVKLDLPFDHKGVDGTIDIYFSGDSLSVDHPVIGYKGTFTYRYVKLETIDYRRKETIPRERSKLLSFDLSKDNTISLKKGNQTSDYKLIVKRVKSDENKIISASVVGAERVILNQENSSIKVVLPYDYSGADFRPSFTLSRGARITPSPRSQSLGEEVTYVVASESGKETTYTVSAEQLVASSEREILRFAIGNLEAEINDLNSTIELDLPRNIDIDKLKPNIYISKYASVSPNSGEEQDFYSGPVVYTVRAQNGQIRDYTVKITSNKEVEVGPSDSAVTKRLSDMVDAVYGRYNYGSSEFLEWINKGIYEGIQNGIVDSVDPSRNGYRIKPDHIPVGLDLARLVGKTNSNRMEEIAKTIMIMTSMGMDASSLSSYSGHYGGYKWEKDKKESSVRDLVSELYNFNPKGNMTLTDYSYGLMALDMGKYNVPKSAKFTREVLIEYLLNTSLTEREPSMGGNIIQGIDRSSMIIQALSPYEDHIIYGPRVKLKLEEALNYLVENIEEESLLFINGGQPDSISGARAINGLIALGIDPYRDPRFAKTNGNAILSWFNNHNTENPHGFGRYGNDYSKDATMYGIYGLQNYLKFVEAGGGKYIPHIDSVPFSFEKILSNEAKINFVELLGKYGAIDDAAGLVKIYMPLATQDEDLMNKPIYIDYSQGGKISPDPNDLYDFTKPVNFNITSEDGENAKNYTIVVERKEGVDSGRSDIEEVVVVGVPKASVRIDNKLKEVEIVLPSDTKEEVLKSISLQILHLGTSISPNPSTPLDYSGGKSNVFNITAQDGNMTSYKFTARIKVPDAFKFTKFSLRGVEGDVNTTHNEIIVRLPKGAYLENIGPNQMNYVFDAASGSDWDVISPIPGLPIKMDFSEGKVVVYSLQSQSAMYNRVDYRVRVEEVEARGKGKINSFSWDGYPGEIKGSTITLYLPEGVTKEDLIDDYPDIKWTGKYLDPDPKKIIKSLGNYLLDYVVTDENGDSQLYKLEVKNKKGLDITRPPEGSESGSSDMEILRFSIDGIEGDIDEATNTIYIELPWEMDLFKVYPEIVIPNDCDIYPYNGLAVNLKNSPVFTLSQGKNRKQYKVVYYINGPIPSTKLWHYYNRDLRNDLYDYQIVN